MTPSAGPPHPAPAAGDHRRDQARRLQKTINAWWKEIEVFITTRVTNANTEAANVTIKNIKRTGRGYRSTINYRSKIMLNNVARSAA